MHLTNNNTNTMARRIHNNKAFTLIELLMVIIILVILAAIAVGVANVHLKKAYRITAMHDLKGFVEAQENYYSANNHYFGSAGDFIEGGNPPVGPLYKPEFPFRPSDGVRIEIISGDGQQSPRSPGFKVESRHKKITTTYVYDFSTGQTTERVQ